MVVSSVYLQDNLMSQIGIEIIRPSKTRIRNLPHPGVLLKVRMPELQARILKPGITKIKHRTDKGWFTRTMQAEAEVRWPTTLTAKAI